MSVLFSVISFRVCILLNFNFVRHRNASGASLSVIFQSCIFQTHSFLCPSFSCGAFSASPRIWVLLRQCTVADVVESTSLFAGLWTDDCRSDASLTDVLSRSCCPVLLVRNRAHDNVMDTIHQLSCVVSVAAAAAARDVTEHCTLLPTTTSKNVIQHHWGAAATSNSWNSYLKLHTMLFLARKLKNKF